MAVSASQLQNLLKEAFPSDPAQMQVTDIMVPSGRTRFAGDEIIGYGESGPMYAPRFEPEMVVGGYYSPALGRQLTAAETQHLIPIQSYVDGRGQVTTGLVYPGERAIKLFNELGYTGSQMSGQATSGGFEVYPLPGTIPTDQGDRTNIAISYGASGAPEARVYQSSTLTGSASLDKIVDQLAKAANAALLTYVGGLALGPAGAGLLANPALAGAAAGVGQAAIKGGDTKDLLISGLGGALMAPGADAAAVAASDLAAIEASMGTPSLLGSSNILDSINQAGIYTPGVEPSLSMTPPPVISEPVLVPGDSALSSTLAQTPLAVENIAGQLTPEAQALIAGGGLAAGTAASDLAAIEGSMGAPVDAGSATKAALYGDAGYGSIDAPIYDASVPTEALPKGAEPSVLKGVGDIVKYTPGALKQYATTALTTLGLDPDLVNTLVGYNQSNETTTTQPGGGGSNLLGPILGGLLSRQQPGAPSPGLIQGKGVDIVSPIQSLLAPKLVQQRPISLL
jgi:hypothetical protein